MVDSAYALYLQSPERLYVATDATISARWPGALSRKMDVSSCLATEADAISEATRQLAFVGGPLVQDRAIIRGIIDVAAYRGRCVTMQGAVLFVLGGDVDHGTGVSNLNVLRRM